MTTTTDKYDAAIEYLTSIYEREGEEAFWTAVYNAWCVPSYCSGGCLFTFCTPDGRTQGCGCLTTVRTGSPAHTSELTATIRADERIPPHPEDIRHPSQLAVFAEYQRLMDGMWPGREAA